ncbi:alkaline phosphatase family protein [Arthrobacter sp. ov118]|uniref:alkaline phosphatase family protein n=1 Tax=Arthrobacter sp. ov118 TaxID=1761747 RepID=UPI0008F11DF8|nr:alkaline phosphatase family protein [Arthrobacter sp. ov118]SFT69662.1 Phosphoesterase family protein [Arthrobacter sp. ov118]
MSCCNATKTARRITKGLLVAALLLVSAAACVPVPPGGGPGPTAGGSAGPTAGGGAGGQAAAKPGHVFVINLENKGYNEVWGADSRATYLSQTLRSQGVLLSQYYGIAHNSNPNYLAQISGQASNAMTRRDCPTYAAFRQTGTAALGQVEGTGCVYPESVPTVAGQLSAAGKTWKAYMEDMGMSCRHPELGAKDGSQGAKVGDEYATRHNPFVYFESITSSPDCQSNVVDYGELAGDLRSVETTPNLSYISPNLCNDGHDNPCVDGSPGGLTAADSWLSRQIPAILDSPAFRRDGMLVITFDEAEGKTVGPSELVPGGTAGGRIGALVLSPFTRGGTTADRPYNHFSLLASIEDAFSLPRLGYAGAPGLDSFGTDVFNGRP